MAIVGGHLFQTSCTFVSLLKNNWKVVWVHGITPSLNPKTRVSAYRFTRIPLTPRTNCKPCMPSLKLRSQDERMRKTSSTIPSSKTIGSWFQGPISKASNLHEIVEIQRPLGLFQFRLSSVKAEG